MPVLKAILLGLLQGVTSVLPVSSSGHVVLVSHLLGVNASTGLKFLSLLHIGTLIALIGFFRKDLKRLAYGILDVLHDGLFNLRVLMKNLRHPEAGDYRRCMSTVYRRFSVMLLISMIPTILVGVLFGKIAEQVTGSLLVNAMGFFVTALILFIASFSANKNRQPSQTKFRDAVMIGVFQGISVFSGVSRAGMVMSGAELAGFSRKYMIKYTMLLGIPAMLGGAVYEALRTGVSLADTVGVGSCVAGVLTAAVISWLVIRTAIKLMSRKTNKFFAVYSLIMGILSVVIYMH